MRRPRPGYSFERGVTRFDPAPASLPRLVAGLFTSRGHFEFHPGVNETTPAALPARVHALELLSVFLARDFRDPGVEVLWSTLRSVRVSAKPGVLDGVPLQSRDQHFVAKLAQLGNIELAVADSQLHPARAMRLVYVMHLLGGFDRDDSVILHARGIAATGDLSTAIDILHTLKVSASTESRTLLSELLKERAQPGDFERARMIATMTQPDGVGESTAFRLNSKVDDTVTPDAQPPRRSWIDVLLRRP